MKTLTLWRHAKTERESPDGDFGRSLTERGRTDADLIGHEIRERGLPGLVVASPARRAVETLSALGELAPIFDRRIYNASARQLLDVVQSADDGADSLLLVGHNPGFEQLAALLAANGPEDFPTAALAEIAFEVDRWRDVKEGSGRLTHFVTPKALKAQN